MCCGSMQQRIYKESTRDLIIVAACPSAQASDVLAELLRKQERAAAAAQAEGGTAGAKARAAKGVQVPDLAELVRVGQLVRCVVAELQGREGGGGAAESAFLARVT